MKIDVKVLVAAIGAAALIIAATVTARCSGESEVEPVDISKRELVELLRARGSEILNDLADSEKRLLAQVPLESDSVEVARLLVQARERFRDLHERHIAAIEDDQLVLAHEILIEIHYLLLAPDHILEAHGGPGGNYMINYSGTLERLNETYTGLDVQRINYSPWANGVVVPEVDYLQEWRDNRLRLDSLVADLAVEYRTP